MTVVDALKSAQFVVDDSGHQTAVLLDIKSWEILLNWFEDVADVKIARQALAELEAAGGRPDKAGWLDWDDISEAWDDEEEETTSQTL